MGLFDSISSAIDGAEDRKRARRSGRDRLEALIRTHNRETDDNVLLLKAPRPGVDRTFTHGGRTYRVVPANGSAPLYDTVVGSPSRSYTPGRCTDTGLAKMSRIAARNLADGDFLKTASACGYCGTWHVQ